MLDSCRQADMDVAMLQSARARPGGMRKLPHINGRGNLGSDTGFFETPGDDEVAPEQHVLPCIEQQGSVHGPCDDSLKLALATAVIVKLDGTACYPSHVQVYPVASTMGWVDYEMDSKRRV